MDHNDNPITLANAAGMIITDHEDGTGTYVVHVGGVMNWAAAMYYALHSIALHMGEYKSIVYLNATRVSYEWTLTFIAAR